MEPHDNAAIRKLMETAFNDDDFQQFCSDHFPEVRKNFTAGQTHGSRILALLDYAKRYGQVEKLLAKIKAVNPYQYGRFASHDKSHATIHANISNSQAGGNMTQHVGDTIHIHSGRDVVFSKDNAKASINKTGSRTGPVTTARNQSSTFDVCVICALPEEAQALMTVFTDHFGVGFDKDFGTDNREYRHAIIRNAMNEELKVHVSCPPRFGPVETGMHCKAVLDEFTPRFAAMTGICAGDRKKVVLGDIVVAERAFIYDGGKVNSDGYDHDVDMFHPNMNNRQYILMFNSWEEAARKLPRPASLRSQKDWILNALLNDTTPRVDDIPPDLRELHAPQWKKAVKALQSETMLTKDRRLVDRSIIEDRRFDEDFPFQDPTMPKCHIAAMASGSSVRSDNPFAMIQAPVRKAVAVDMEGAAFYRAVADYPGISSLLVKGVCDYADPEKDDSFHAYASAVSAVYVSTFVREYVNSRLMPVKYNDLPGR